MPQESPTPTVRVVLGGELLKLRLESSRRALSMTQAEALAQMRRNGSVPSPNPWYDPQEKRKGALVRMR